MLRDVVAGTKGQWPIFGSPCGEPIPWRVMASGIGRILDPATPSNRFILILSPLAGALAGAASLVSGETFGEAIGRGIGAGGAAFLAWAIGRELDPDHPLSAGVAAVLAPPIGVLGPPELVGAALILIAARIVAGTTGRLPTPVDLGVVGAGAAVVAARATGPGLVGVAALALVMAAAFEPPARVRILLGALALVAIGAGIAVWADRAPVGPELPATGDLVILVAGAVATTLAVAFLPTVVSETDHGTRRSVSTRRVRLARATTGAAAMVAWMWGGEAGVAAAAALWAALVAVAVFSVFAFATRK